MFVCLSILRMWKEMSLRVSCFESGEVINERTIFCLGLLNERY